MATVVITNSLYKEISKKFKGETPTIIRHLMSLAKDPNKGKLIGNVTGILIKELKYRNFRFYFIAKGDILKIVDSSHIMEQIYKFVRMSDKKSQQKIIDEIKHILKTIGPSGFT